MQERLCKFLNRRGVPQRQGNTGTINSNLSMYRQNKYLVKIKRSKLVIFKLPLSWKEQAAKYNNQ